MMSQFSYPVQVLIVDDGSRDHTSRVAFDYVRKYKIDNVRVLLLGRNHGKGEAIRKVSPILIIVVTLSLQFCFYLVFSANVSFYTQATGMTNAGFLFPFQQRICTNGMFSHLKQGMLHSRGNVLLMLDADGATKLTDLEKLESQV